VLPTLFISDLHLCPARPQSREHFLTFVDGTAQNADALYILGDLFEYWAGDDDLGDPFNADICAGLRRLADRGVKTYFMAGNRDFLLGEKFAAAAGLHLLAEPHRADVAGVPTLMLHGDALCTDDIDYQRFRATVRSPNWSRAFLGEPLTVRKARIEALRRESEAASRSKPMALMDVVPEAVANLLQQFDTPPRLIHGHTHRPACHRLTVAGKSCERWVLPAWDIRPGFLVVDGAGCRPVAIA